DDVVGFEPRHLPHRKPVRPERVGRQRDLMPDDGVVLLVALCLIRRVDIATCGWPDASARTRSTVLMLVASGFGSLPTTWNSWCAMLLRSMRMMCVIASIHRYRLVESWTHRESLPRNADANSFPRR